MPGVFFQPFSLAPSHSAHEPGQHFACHGRGSERSGKPVWVTQPLEGVGVGCRAPAPGHPTECGVRLTFQPLLGFYLDLEITGGGGILGKKRKVRNVIREGKKGKKSPGQTQGQRPEARILWGTGLGKAATLRPRRGPEALQVALSALSPCPAGLGPSSKGAGPEISIHFWTPRRIFSPEGRWDGPGRTGVSGCPLRPL